MKFTKMRYKRLTQLSICFVILIFLSQAFLIFRLFQINKDLLNRELNLISQEAYTKDMNSRFDNASAKDVPGVRIGDKDTHVQPDDIFYNVDSMPDVDKSSSMTVLNIGMEMYLSEEKPIKLHPIDSIASQLFREDGFDVALYSRIVDTKHNKILQSSKKDHFKSSLFIKSKDIPLNFQQTKVLQLVLLNPLRGILSQMIGILLLSFLLSLFCIYCLYVLQQTLAKQKKLAQSKNDFYNQVSHELKRPISIMYKAVDSLLNTSVIDNQEKREKYLNISMNELSRMNGKIDMILTMSMEEEGMLKLNMSEFDILKLVQEIKERALEIASKPTDITVHCQLNQPFITADMDHISQCLSNLMENAVKYSGENVEIKINLSEDDQFMFLSVLDNGNGIKEEDLGKIFEKFTRVGSDQKMHGYGIGLSYVKQIVEKHGGCVSVKSIFGKGSEFMLQLPKVQSL
ncbi:MAG: HAMP domain-containing sensor histidine kinase [Bacteroidales bacterium]|nr:HAMP domain-containing sensor histidine kinase [Bacteroidales bacterium]